MESNEIEAKKLLQNPLQFKLFCAKRELDLIPTFVPLDDSPREKILTEIVMENFLFYSISALDIIFQKINKKMNLGLEPNQVRLRTLVNKLEEKNDPISEEILKQINSYFQEPHHEEERISTTEAKEAFAKCEDYMLHATEYENREGIRYHHTWNRKNSRLWELKNQRNLITHDSLLNFSGLRGTVKAKDYLQVRLVYNDELHKIWDSIHFENPKSYYSESFMEVLNFINDIQKILEPDE